MGYPVSRRVILVEPLHNHDRWRDEHVHCPVHDSLVEPQVCSIQCGFGISGLRVDGIIYNYAVCVFSRNCSPDTNGVAFATVGVCKMRRLIQLDLDFRETFLVQLALNNITAFTAEAVRQRHSMRTSDDLGMRHPRPLPNGKHY
jgi:hypothetical protein